MSTRIRPGKDSNVSEQPDPEDGESLAGSGDFEPVANVPATPLLRDRSFLGMMATQFLGAFNDNLFKQLMLLLAIPVGAAAAVEKDRQAVATIVFAIPFILFSGYAGFLSDRFSKRRIIVLAKVAEIVVMMLGLIAFLQFQLGGTLGLLLVLFLMGMQSAFFGPGKYGILPEMLPKKHLPRANGMILMTTFLAIIFGTAVAGFLGESFIDDTAIPELRAVGLWRGSILCVGIAITGTLTSLVIRRLPAAKPNLKLHRNSLVVPADTRRLLAQDRALLMALFASCVFWLVSGIAIQAVNSLGVTQLREGRFRTSVMTAVIGLGIALGAVIAGRLSRGKIDFRIARFGLWGLVLFLALLSVSRTGGVHLLGFSGSLVALTLLGMSAGFFAIPVQVFIQERPPKEQKGRMIAAMNFFNFIAILLSGVLYYVFDRTVEWQGWPRSMIFAMMAGIVLPLAILYQPKNVDANN
ncbi:MAG: MFS transporter [Planctomycetaceae bacterium]|nr:MFS transporter [Planctomycetaceae bacterium]